MRISEQLLDSILNERVSDDGMCFRQDNCLYGVEEDLTLSCFTIDWDLNRVFDLNGDSMPDLLVRVIDEGLGGGGNMYGYDYEVIILNAEKRITEKYSLFGGGKFSYAHLSIDRVTNGRIYATYRQNPYTYDDEDVEMDSVKLEFFIENNQLREAHYAACPLSAMDKRIFRNDLEFRVDRSPSLDDAYNEEQIETLFLADSTHYYASLNGCESMELSFHHSFPFDESLQTSKSLIKSTWIEHLDFLIASTRYPSMLSEVREQLSKPKHQAFVPDEYGNFNESFVLKNNWTCRLFLSGNEAQSSYVSILVENEAMEELTFWEELKQKVD
jgi:hypothetical protein